MSRKVRGAHTATEDESEAGTKAKAAIRKIQTGAKEYEEKNPERLDAFYVGQPLKSRSQIEQAATACCSLIGDKRRAGQHRHAQGHAAGYRCQPARQHPHQSRRLRDRADHTRNRRRAPLQRGEHGTAPPTSSADGPRDELSGKSRLSRNRFVTRPFRAPCTVVSFARRSRGRRPSI